MSTTPPAPLSPKRSDLKSALAQVSLRDESRLRRKLDRARTPDALVALAEEIETARTRLAARSANVPAVSYPEALPVSQRKDDIATAISENQVVIVAGETGSGKTTQIPKICLELGRGVRCAVTVAVGQRDADAARPFSCDALAESSCICEVARRAAAPPASVPQTHAELDVPRGRPQKVIVQSRDFPAGAESGWAFQ